MDTMHKLIIVVTKHKTTSINVSYSSPPTPVQRDEGDASTSPNLAYTKLQKTIVNPKI